MTSHDAPPPRGPANDEHRQLSRTEAHRREEQRRIDRDHRRAKRPRIGWDWSRGSDPRRQGRVRRRRRRLTVTDALGVVVVAAGSAWVLQLQGVTPTGDPGQDPLITSGVAIAVALVGAAIDRHLLVAWGIVAIVATTGRQFLGGITFNTLAGSGWPFLIGLVAMLLGSGVALINRRGRTVFAPVIGALSASLTLQCLATLPESNWPTVGGLLAGATLLGALYAIALRVRPRWLFD